MALFLPRAAKLEPVSDDPEADGAARDLGSESASDGVAASGASGRSDNYLREAIRRSTRTVKRSEDPPAVNVDSVGRKAPKDPDAGGACMDTEPESDDDEEAGANADYDIEDLIARQATIIRKLEEEVGALRGNAAKSDRETEPSRLVLDDEPELNKNRVPQFASEKINKLLTSPNETDRQTEHKPETEAVDPADRLSEPQAEENGQEQLQEQALEGQAQCQSMRQQKTEAGFLGFDGSWMWSYGTASAAEVNVNDKPPVDDTTTATAIQPEPQPVRKMDPPDSTEEEHAGLSDDENEVIQTVEVDGETKDNDDDGGDDAEDEKDGFSDATKDGQGPTEAATVAVAGRPMNIYAEGEAVEIARTPTILDDEQSVAELSQDSEVLVKAAVPQATPVPDSKVTEQPAVVRPAKIKVTIAAIQRVRNYTIALRNIEDVKYTGQVTGSPSGLLAHGSGIARFPSGAMYAGEFANGKMHGQGTFHLTSAPGSQELCGTFVEDIYRPDLDEKKRGMTNEQHLESAGNKEGPVAEDAKADQSHIESAGVEVVAQEEGKEAKVLASPAAAEAESVADADEDAMPSVEESSNKEDEPEIHNAHAEAEVEVASMDAEWEEQQIQLMEVIAEEGEEDLSVGDRSGASKAATIKGEQDENDSGVLVEKAMAEEEGKDEVEPCPLQQKKQIGNVMAKKINKNQLEASTDTQNSDDGEDQVKPEENITLSVAGAEIKATPMQEKDVTTDAAVGEGDSAGTCPEKKDEVPSQDEHEDGVLIGSVSEA